MLGFYTGGGGGAGAETVYVGDGTMYSEIQCIIDK